MAAWSHSPTTDQQSVGHLLEQSRDKRTANHVSGRRSRGVRLHQSSAFSGFHFFFFRFKCATLLFAGRKGTSCLIIHLNLRNGKKAISLISQPVLIWAVNELGKSWLTFSLEIKMKMSLLLSDEKKYWSLGQPVESSSFKKKKKWKQKRNYANEHDAKRNGWLLKEKPEKYGEGHSCKWPIFKSRTRVLQRWADYFFFKKNYNKS